MDKHFLTNLFSDQELMAELHDVANSRGFSAAKAFEVEPKTIISILDQPLNGKLRSLDEALAEAIILEQGRPSLIIKDDMFEQSQLSTWRQRLDPFRSSLSQSIKSIGRIELKGHPSYEWVGTGWLVTNDIIATNRHVAKIFAQRSGQRFVFSRGIGNQLIQANIDFKEEYNGLSPSESDITEVLYIADDGWQNPDLAFLRLQSTSSLPSPLVLAETSQPTQPYIAVVGYPARDDFRNDPIAATKIFQDVYNIKRFAPGMLLPSNGSADPLTFTHDCSTLGGNSGSAVLDIATGKVIGLHFGGKFLQANVAVKAEVIRDYLRRVDRIERRPRPGTPLGVNVANYANRRGYDRDFIGREGNYVPLPTLTQSQEEDAVKLTGGSEQGSYELKYTHFSVVMSKKRKLAYFTAVNIDGRQLRRFSRSDNWRLDPRIPTQYQTGNEAYSNNRYDRGHMVRRLDPVWGSEEEARQADDDTFHYTNSCPQHEDLNQRTWLGLEDYILNNAGAWNVKISVFTGPVFKETDRLYRNIVKIPEAFWKVVVMSREDGRLSATAYLLSQSHLVSREEGVFGPYQTYQVSIAKIEQETGLRFGDLRRYDPLEGNESVDAFTELRRLDDIVL